MMTYYKLNIAIYLKIIETIISLNYLKINLSNYLILMLCIIIILAKEKCKIINNISILKTIL